MEEANKRIKINMFLAEYNRLRNYTKFVIEEGNLESIEDGLLDELYDTSNEYLKRAYCVCPGASTARAVRSDQWLVEEPW